MIGWQVLILEKLRHPNIVNLLGHSDHIDANTREHEQILVLEFVPNGDLDFHIHDPKGTPPPSVLSASVGSFMVHP